MTESRLPHPHHPSLRGPEEQNTGPLSPAVRSSVHARHKRAAYQASRSGVRPSWLAAAWATVWMLLVSHDREWRENRLVALLLLAILGVVLAVGMIEGGSTWPR